MYRYIINVYEVLKIPPYHIFNVSIIIAEFLVQVLVESRDHEVAVVLVLEEFLDAAHLEPADPLALLHAGHHLLQELLVLTGGTSIAMLYYVNNVTTENLK